MRTIRGKFMLAFIGLVFFIFIMFWVGMEFFIETYYYGQKINSMQNMVTQINTVMTLDQTPLQQLEDLQYLGYNFEGKINIIDSEKGIVISDDDILEYSKGVILESIRVSRQGASAYILETNYPVKGTKWLVYAEMIDTGEIAVLQIPLAAIDQTIEAMSYFLIYIGAAIILVAIIIAGIISTNMTRPVKKLTMMADSLRQLNFDVEYKEERQDELGELGETFNALSAQLDATIKKLQYELSKEKELDTLRKQFIAQVSHELQTPLSVIHGYIEALEDGVVDSDEERDEYYDIIGEETGKMSRMIKELLQLSEMESGTFKANKQPLEMANFLDQINKAYQTMLLHEPISLNYKPFKGEAWLMADQMKLEQAIRNILNNAMKYAEPETAIRFLTHLEDQVLTITIENDGPKIPEEELAMIFESFYKGSNSSMKEGTGIGLAVTAKVLKVHEATFFAKNIEKGVQFVIKLKLDESLV